MANNARERRSRRRWTGRKVEREGIERVKERERETERPEDAREERERGAGAGGRVISFLCLLLIYSDAPRLSASGANKFLEPPRQLNTPALFPAPSSPSPPPPPTFPLLTLFPPCDPLQRRDILAALNTPSAPRRPM